MDWNTKCLFDEAWKWRMCFEGEVVDPAYGPDHWATKLASELSLKWGAGAVAALDDERRA